MELKSFPMAILIIGMILLGSVFFLTDFGNKYSQTADLTGMENINKSAVELQDDLNETRASLNTILDPDKGSGFTVPFDLIKAGYYGVKSILASFGFFSAIFGDLSNVLSGMGIPIPAWFINTIVAVIVLGIIIMLVYAFFKWKIKDD